MKTSPRARLFAATLACLWATVAVTQEQPVPTPAPADAATPGLTSVSAPESLVTPIPGAKRIVVLPVEFTVYEDSVAGLEAVPDWSESAQYALGDAAAKMLRLDNRFEIVAMPTIEGEAEGLLREHVELFKIVADCVTELIPYGGKAWKEKRTNFDYSLGPGLAFLADSAQADYAFFLAGTQIKQTVGSKFMQALANFTAEARGDDYEMSGSSGTDIVAGVVNLRSGDLAWFNWNQGGLGFGRSGNDVRDPATALAVVSKMFKKYPNSKLITFKPF